MDDVFGGGERGFEGDLGGVIGEVGVDGFEGGDLVGSVGDWDDGGTVGEGSGGRSAAAEARVGVAVGCELPWIGGGGCGGGGRRWFAVL